MYTARAKQEKEHDFGSMRTLWAVYSYVEIWFTWTNTSGCGGHPSNLKPLSALVEVPKPGGERELQFKMLMPHASEKAAQELCRDAQVLLTNTQGC
ncbi:unnamed protein product [Ceratitis capitata]|uniref:(Mediterranean fruit fly) hypothetical protein n=1 Tax=Ceratitis capitata TaxID=7213 RepID=A0A811VEI3_CERCA|nr:unnamed protein product [Ceratitis capitata]